MKLLPMLSLLMDIEAIYFDSDGVFADFTGEKNAMARFKTEPGFFANLKPLPAIKYLNKYIEKYGCEKVFILTSSPNEQADTDKMIFFGKYAPKLDPTHIIIIRNGEDKSKYVKNIKKSILVDDYSGNLIKWKEAGGFSIKFLNKGDSDNKNSQHRIHGIPSVRTFKNLI